MNMNTITDKQKYTILERKTIACRIIDIEKKAYDAFIIKFGDYDNGGFLYSKKLYINKCNNQYEELLNDMQKRTKFFLQKLLIKPAIKVYHVWTWDDFHNNKCGNSCIGEIERDQDGNPRLYEQFTHYTEASTVINEKIINLRINEYGVIQDYIPENAPNIQYRLAYRNQYNAMKTRSYRQDEIYNEYDYEDTHEDIDRTPEDIVMSALENGNGDSLGF